MILVSKYQFIGSSGEVVLFDLFKPGVGESSHILGEARYDFRGPVLGCLGMDTRNSRLDDSMTKQADTGRPSGV